MSKKRSDLTLEVARLVGSSVMAVEEAASGWPSSTIVFTDSGAVRVALHVAPVGHSHRKRDDVERRLQNPGQDRPIAALPDQLPVILGIWEEEEATVFVALDGRSRVGRATRFSVFPHLDLLRAAAVKGWEEGYTESNERFVAFHPALLPNFIQMLRSDVSLDPTSVAIAVSAAGLLDQDTPAVERGRRTVSSLVRSAEFSRRVREAYGGLCAMCGLNFSLVVGAHIHPVAALGAPDEIWNGLALCHNHHSAFDAHLVYIDPESRRIVVHPELHASMAKSSACTQFVRGTFAVLASPLRPEHLPRPEMLTKRYSYFAGRYEWASS